MGNKTGIEWTDATWNPVTGCSKVSQGCKYCYAERIFHRPYPGRDFTDVHCHPERLDQPLRWKRPRRIFVNSMSDLFHEKVPYPFLTRVFLVMSDSCNHTFQILTKRPRRALEEMKKLARGVAWKEWPLSNVWIGVSVENQETADERIPILLQTPAVVRFVSYEPALGLVDFEKFLLPHFAADDDRYQRPLDWTIAGGESGPHARPSHPDWFRSVRDQCQAAGVAFFFKQWGEYVPYDQATPTQRETRCISRASLSGNAGEPGHWLRLGKRCAGRLLDGREWNEFPLGRRQLQ